ncbi:MAG: hypothetical protein QXD03_02405 [Candidatus Anstonellales archaeon]
MRYYLCYRPSLQNRYGACYLNQFISDGNRYPGIEYREVASDGDLHFGFIESDDSDQLARFWKAITGVFSAERLTYEEFIGACYLNYNPPPAGLPEDDPTPRTFQAYMLSVGFDNITDDFAIDCLKKYKKYLFKEIVRKRFEDYNDISADITKLMFFMFYHYHNLTQDEKSEIDSVLQQISEIYTKDVCLSALSSIKNQMDNYLVPYYQKINDLESKTTKEEVVGVKLDI